MSRATLLALAARGEAAQEAETHTLLRQVLDALALPRIQHYRIARFIAAGAYLEAAASLAGEGGWSITYAHQPDMGGKQWTATIRRAGHYRATARKPALALTAAALRATAEEAADE